MAGRPPAGSVVSRWPKILPPLPDDLRRINDDFMDYWLTALPHRYGFADRFNHRYAVRMSPAEFVRTLEIGAGTGEHLRYETLTEEQRRGYVALELRENIAARFREAHPDIRVEVGDCQSRLGFPDGHFDRILAIHVLEHLPDLPKAVEEAYGFAAGLLPRASSPCGDSVRPARRWSRSASTSGAMALRAADSSSAST
jgi:hypothetical protein